MLVSSALFQHQLTASDRHSLAGLIVLADNIEDALSRLSVYPFAGLTELCERGTQIIIPGNVAVKDRAIMLRHLKRGMSEQVLERKRITTAVHQIFPSERVAEHMNTCFQHAPLMVIVRDCQLQGVL